MKILEDISIDKIDISKIEMIISQQNTALLEMYKLILFDDTSANRENNKLAKAFLETQMKALEHLEKLVQKHKEELKPKVKRTSEKTDHKHTEDDDDEQNSLFE